MSVCVPLRFVCFDMLQRRLANQARCTLVSTRGFARSAEEILQHDVTMWREYLAAVKDENPAKAAKNKNVNDLLRQVKVLGKHIPG